MKFLESDCGTTCGLLFNFMTWFTCLCLVISGYIHIVTGFYCLLAKDVACYSPRIVFSAFGVLFIFTLPVINLIVGYIIFKVVVISSGVSCTIFTLGGVILAGVRCDGSIWVTYTSVLICGYFCDKVGPCVANTLGCLAWVFIC